jgi:hypothetical protein
MNKKTTAKRFNQVKDDADIEFHKQKQMLKSLEDGMHNT